LFSGQHRAAGPIRLQLQPGSRHWIYSRRHYNSNATLIGVLQFVCGGPRLTRNKRLHSRHETLTRQSPLGIHRIEKEPRSPDSPRSRAPPSRFHSLGDSGRLSALPAGPFSMPPPILTRSGLVYAWPY